MMISASFAVALAALSALAGIAVSWGVLQTLVKQLRDSVVQLQADVKALTGIVSDLKIEVAVVRERANARHNTGPHLVHPQG